MQVATRCKSRRCPSCGVLWAGDTRRKLLANIEAHGGAVALVTITAPGADLLPWDPQACAHLAQHRHSGLAGCRVHPLVAKLYNEQSPEDWRRLHRLASQRAKRFAKRAGGRWSVVAMEWEFQTRGVLHRHVVVPMESPLDRLGSQVYVGALSEHARGRGFGYVDRGKRAQRGGVWSRMLEVVPAQRAARYLAKYIAAVDAGAGKITLSATVSHPQVPGHVSYVGRELTRRTGVTMRSLRDRRHAHWLLHHSCVAVTADLAAKLARYCSTGTPRPWSDRELIAELAPRGP